MNHPEFLGNKNKTTVIPWLFCCEASKKSPESSPNLLTSGSRGGRFRTEFQSHAMKFVRNDVFDELLGDYIQDDSCLIYNRLVFEGFRLEVLSTMRQSLEGLEHRDDDQAKGNGKDRDTGEYR